MPRHASTPCATSMLQNLHIMPGMSSAPTTPTSPKVSLPTGWGGASPPNSPTGTSAHELIPESSAKVRRGQQGQAIGLDEENMPTFSRMRMSKSPSPSAGSSNSVNSLQTTLLTSGAIRDPRVAALQRERENEAPFDARMPAPATLAAALRPPSPSSRMRSRLSLSAYPKFGSGAATAAGGSGGGDGGSFSAWCEGSGSSSSQRGTTWDTHIANDAPSISHFGRLASARLAVRSGPLGRGD